MALNVTVKSGLATKAPGDLLVIGVDTAYASKKKGEADATFSDADKALGKALSRLVQKEEFKGKRDQSITTSTVGKLRAPRLIVQGVGDAAASKSDGARLFAARAARAANADRATSLVLAVPASMTPHLRAIAEGLELGSYRFTKYLTGDRKPKAQLEHVTVVIAGKVDAQAKAAVDLGQRVGQAVNLARDLSNEPSNVMTPVALANVCSEVAKTHHLKIKVFDFKEIQRRGMRLIEAVGRGSTNEPRFVHMTYAPQGKPKKRIVFLGKGVTFDSGGLSIKPAAGMGEMKADMSGAGNMAGLAAALAAVKPQVEVHLILACAENMPDGNAYRPGDVWPSLDGKNVEIINTDAEGRLLLADALAYARTLEPDLMIDNATLTGACVVALGPSCSAWYAASDDAAAQFAAAVEDSGEQMWRMPLLEDLREQLKSDIADVKQTGDRFGGSITAALFLREFIGESKNWVHCDIAGPALADRVLGWSPKGATGHGLLTYLALVERAARA
jgi:leucyl aminopeptidase